MPVYQDNITFAGLNCYDPGQAVKECELAREPVDWWWGKCNSFRMPRGHEAGRGWLLLTGAQLDTIDIEANDHQLIFAAGNDSITIENLSVVKAEAILPGPEDSPTTLFVVEVADRRVYGKLTYGPGIQGTNSRGFNIRNLPVDGEFEESAYDHTHNSRKSGTTPTVTYTWAEMFETQWLSFVNGMGVGAWATVDVSDVDYPTAKPENMTYDGSNGWECFNHTLKHIGHAVVAKRDGTFKIQPVGRNDTSLQTTLDTLKNTGKLLRARHTRLNSKALMPAAVAVHFPYNVHTGTGSTGRTVNAGQIVTSQSWVSAPYFRVRVLTANILDSSYPVSTANTWATVHDSLVAIHDATDAMTASGTPFTADYATNTSTLNTRANEIAEAWLRTHYNQYLPALTHNTYSGLVDLDTGPLVSGIVWYDTGDGLKTDLVFHPHRLDMGSTRIDSVPLEAVSLNLLDNPGPADIGRPHPPTDIICPVDIGPDSLLPWSKVSYATSDGPSLAVPNWQTGTSTIEGFTGGSNGFLNNLYDAMGHYFVPGQAVLGMYSGFLNKWMAVSGLQVHLGFTSEAWRADGEDGVNCIAPFYVRVNPVAYDGTTATGEELVINIPAPGGATTSKHPNVVASEYIVFAKVSGISDDGDEHFWCLSEVLDDRIGTVKIIQNGASIPGGWALMDGSANSAGSGIDMSDKVPTSDSGTLTTYDPGDWAGTSGGDTYNPATLTLQAFRFIERMDNSA